MKWIAFVSAAVVSVLLAGSVSAQVCNVKVVTDANPDYSDIGSMIHSITDNWQTDKEKCWTIWYWNKIARRQTNPMQLHGMALTDPVRQFNDYGYTMCSTVAGVNCAIWGAMGYDVKYWDISAHTVCEVFYDGAWHMYDSSLTALYTTCDGSRLAAVDEIGADGSCAASGGKVEPGHIAKYHCLTATGPNGFLTGADTQRSVAEEYRCFNPNGLKFRYYYNDWSLGHRYILNLREGESYTRTYRKLGDTKDYYVPNPPPDGKDPESANPRYRIRGNGQRSFEPRLDGNTLAKVVNSMSGVRAMNPAGVAPVLAGEPGEVIFKVEGANVITSTTIKAALVRRTAADAVAIAVSTNNGFTWKEVWNAGENTGEVPAEVKLVDEVNGAYEVLVKVTLKGAADPMGAQLQSIRFDTITMLNSKTQPRLKIGRNTVYVGTGAPTGSVVLWPDLQGDRYKENVVEEQNVACDKKHGGWHGSLHAPGDGDGWVVYRIDTPNDMTTLTYGGRFYNRAPRGYIKMFHSFDGGKTWTESYAVPDTTSPWDVIHYVRADAPAGTRSALVKYLVNSPNPNDTGHGNSIYAVQMEANHKVAEASFKPMEVTFTWSEAQPDYSFVRRSHTQLVQQVPFTYTINVGGVDHPVTDSLRVNLKGALPELKYGYSDGEDVGGEPFVGRWVTVGKILSTGKPYTCTVPSGDNWGAGDPDGKKLTDGVVGPPYAGGTSYASSAIWPRGSSPVITVDLGETMTCGAFRIDVGGYDFQDGIRGKVKDKVEVLVSSDDKDYASVGFFDLSLRWKDIPANYAWNDEETFNEHNYTFIPEKPVAARYVRFALTPSRLTTVSEVQVLDSITYKPFDLKIALPDGKDRSDITKYLPKHTPSQPYKPAKRGG